MFGIFDAFNNLGASILSIIVIVVGLIIVFKLAKEIIGFIIKVGVLILIIYILYNYTPLYYYIHGILSSLGIL